MNGADYIAQVRLSNKADDTLALPGETCERVRQVATPLGWQALIASGKVVRRDQAPTAPVTPTPVVDTQIDYHPLPDMLGDEE